jgi:hypothetical protein
MPYTWVDKHIKLGEHDRRRSKLTDEDREEVKRLYHQEKMAKRAIARLYADKCSLSLICIILDEKRAQAVKRRMKENWKKYSDRNKLTAAARKWRAYKHELIKNKTI